ncbi:methylation-associated defense system helix-turn-helix domain-containing protein MAD1, partial [Xanthomonas citri]
LIRPSLTRINRAKPMQNGLGTCKLLLIFTVGRQDLAMDDRWLSVDEIADYLGVAKDTIYTWVTSKGMPGHKVGRFWKFKKEDVDTWVREGGAAASTDDFDNKEPRNA